MKFSRLGIDGAWLIELAPFVDERGEFCRWFCEEAFRKQGLETHFCQANRSSSRYAGTFRGLHCQTPPFAESKLVSCSEGSVLDVMVDVRRNSPTFGSWETVVLFEKDHRAVYVPRGIAHGYLSLCDGAGILYQTTAPYSPEHEIGVRYDDPFFGIELPIAATILSPKDRIAKNVPPGFSGFDFP